MTISPAAAHTLELLNALARTSEPQPAAGLVRQLGLPRSTAYRLLATLERYGYVSHLQESGRYALGPAAYELTWAYERQAPLQRAARPLLARLVEQTQQSAHLSVLLGRDVLYVIEERAPRRPSLVSDIGVRLPAELTASGRAMLAELPSAQISALYPSRELLVDRTGNGPRTVTRLRAILAGVRARGYAEEVHAITPGLASVAAAVLDHSGHPVAAVAVTYPVESVGPEQEAVLVAHTRRTASALAGRLGGTSPGRRDPKATGAQVSPGAQRAGVSTGDDAAAADSSPRPVPGG